MSQPHAIVIPLQADISFHLTLHVGLEYFPPEMQFREHVCGDVFSMSDNTRIFHCVLLCHIKLPSFSKVFTI